MARAEEIGNAAWRYLVQPLKHYKITTTAFLVAAFAVMVFSILCFSKAILQNYDKVTDLGIFGIVLAICLVACGAASTIGGCFITKQLGDDFDQIPIFN
jgi:hypothetical protein